MGEKNEEKKCIEGGLRMNKYVKVIAILCILLMVATVSVGCGLKTGDQIEQNDGTDPKSTDTVETNNEGPEVIKPKFMIRGDSASLSNYGEKGMAKFILEKFKIDMSDVTVYSSDVYEEKQNIVMMSGDLPDYMSYRGELNEANQLGMDGLLLPLNDIYDGMSNMVTFFEKYPEEREHLLAPDGNIYVLGESYVEKAVYNGNLARQDLAGDFDISSVESLEDYYNLYKAISENWEGPVVSHRKGIKGILRFLRTVGLYEAGTYYDPVDDTFKFTYYKNDIAYDTVAFLRRLYMEGLMDPDILGQSSDVWEPAIADGQWPAMIYEYCMFGYNSEDANPEMDWKAVPPVKVNGEVVPIKRDYMMSYENVFGAKTKYAERIAEMINYFSGTEGQMVSLYGIEGEDFMVIDGVPKLLYEIENQPARLPEGTVLKPAEELSKHMQNWGYTSALQVLHPMYLISGASSKPAGYVSKWISDYLPTYEESWLGKPWPTPILSDELSDKKTQLETRALEYVSNMIVGNMEMTSWADMEAELEQMGIVQYLNDYAQTYQSQK